MKTFPRTFLPALGLAAALLGVAPGAWGQGASLEPAPGRYFVSPSGNDQWSGKLVGPNATRTDGPFATLGHALAVMRKEPLKGTAYVRGGVYHLAEPLTITPDDSGLRLEAYPGEHPVLSGGRVVTGWGRATNEIWMANLPEVRSRRLFFGQAWLGSDAQPRARHPNASPADPYTGGWSFAVHEGPSAGAFGAVLSRIHTAQDWLEWTIEVPADGNYRIAFLYAAQNAPFGYNNLAGRMTLQVGANQPVPLQNLPDTGGFNVLRWNVVATIPLTQGRHVLRWTNVQGGLMNLDALAFSDDAAWNPAGITLTRPAPGRFLGVVQAESFTSAQCKEMVKPALPSPSFKDRFQFKVGDLKAYPRSPEPEIHLFPGNSLLNTIVQVRLIDLTNRVVHLQPNSNSGQDILAGNRYYVANVFEELDAPGEWYLDRASGNLYFWPPKPDFQAQPFYVPMLDRLVEFKGDPARNRWVEEFVIKGFEFRHTTYSRGAPVSAPGDAALWLAGARKCVIEGNRFLHLGGYAVRLENKSALNEIVGNEMAHLGQGGVLLHGNTAGQPTGNLIAGNWMHHLGEVYKQVAGVLANCSSGNRIAHNRMEHLPRCGVALRSPDTGSQSHTNWVEFNDLQFLNTETAESGAIETVGRHKKDTGNVIQYNRIRDTGGLVATRDGRLLTPYATAGILLDDYSSGTLVRGNVVARSVLGGVAVQGGRNNTITNNIFVDGGEHQVRFVVRDSFCQSNRFARNVIAFKSADANLYQHLGTWTAQVLAEAGQNVFWHPQGAQFFNGPKVTPRGPLRTWQGMGPDKTSVVADPLFTNPAADDFTLRPGSPVLGLGFAPIPFEKIGLAGFERAWKPVAPPAR